MKRPLSALLTAGFAVSLVGSLVAACSPGVGSGLAKAPKAEGCDPTALNGVVSPLIVEWPSNARSDLESAMHDGVVVVSFTCDKVTVLPDCKVKGSYGYRAVTPRVETTLIEGKDNIQASFGGVAWAVSGNLSREAKLDLSYVLVGKMSTTRAAVHRGDLEGGDDFCKGATHFVKRADVGAFAYASGTKVQAGMSAKALGQGTSGDTKSDEVQTKKDGDQAACKSGKLADGKAPEGCAAGIRVSLAPIKEGGTSKDESVSKKGVSDGLGCPKGFAYVDGACTDKPGDKAVLCADGDEKDCEKQCAAGSDPSCDRYARVLLYRDEEGKQDAKVMGAIKANATRFEAACAADQPAACTALGVQILMEMMTKGDLSNKAQAKRAWDFMANGCRAGDYVACSFLRFTAADPDMQKETGIDGEKLFADAITRGCAAGNATPCGFMAFEHAAGKGKLAHDPKKALELADKACLGAFTEACQFHAALLGDAPRCEKIWSGTSEKLAHVYDAKDLCSATSDIPHDAARAKKSLEQACSLGAKSACGG